MWTDIYNALAAVAIDFTDGRGNSKSIPCLGLGESRGKVEAVLCPTRMQLPPGTLTRALDNISYEYDKALVRFSYEEQLLYQPVGQYGGLDTVLPDLVRYLDAYVEKMTTLQKVAGATIVGVEPRAGVLNYPRGSSDWFHGVTMIVRLEGVLCP